MARIRYIGAKGRKEDNVAGTGLVWAKGQVHDVPDKIAAAKLLSYTQIWADEQAPYTPAQPNVATNGAGEWNESEELRSRMAAANMKMMSLVAKVEERSLACAKAEARCVELEADIATLRKDLDAAEAELDQWKDAPPAHSAPDRAAPPPEAPPPKVDFSIDEIRAALTAKGVDFPKTANKATLLKILQGD